MTMNSIYYNITKIIKENNMVIENAVIKNKTKLFQDLAIDSLSFVILVTEIEDYYNIDIVDELERIDISSTIQDLINIIEEVKSNE